jgi:hypothetical protein
MNTEKQNGKSLDDDFFIKNAILCWMHHFPGHKWSGVYQELLNREFKEKKDVPKARPARRRKPRVSQSSAT